MGILTKVLLNDLDDFHNLFTQRQPSFMNVWNFSVFCFKTPLFTTTVSMLIGPGGQYF